MSEAFLVKSLKKKTKGKYLVQIDELEYELFEDTIVKHNLYEGSCVFNIDEILKSNDEVALILKFKTHLLKYPKSEKEFSFYLKTRYPEIKDIDYIISILREQRYLDDKTLAKYKFRIYEEKAYGINYIRHKFYELGLSSYLDDLLIDYAPDIDRILLKEIKKYSFLDKKQEKEKLYTSLYRKGYNYDDINKLYLRYLELKEGSM